MLSPCHPERSEGSLLYRLRFFGKPQNDVMYATGIVPKASVLEEFMNSIQKLLDFISV